MGIVPRLADYFGYKPQTLENNQDGNDHDLVTKNETIMKDNVEIVASSPPTKKE
jgi:hypothetical protein